MCKREREGQTVCYPMLESYDHTKGDNDNYFGCPVDMQACVNIQIAG